MEVRGKTVDYGLKGNNYFFLRDCDCGVAVLSYCDSSLQRSSPPLPTTFRLKRREKSTRPVSKQAIREFKKLGII